MQEHDFFETIKQQYQQKLPFVVYRKPNKAHVNALLQACDTLVFTKDFTEQGFVFSPFDTQENTVIIPLNKSKPLCLEQFKLPTPLSAHPDNTKLKTAVDLNKKQNHISLVQKGVEAIKKGVFKKVVLSRQETIDIENDNPLHILKQLLHKYQSAFVYCWYHPKVGLWLGATPETLIKIEGGRFSIMALAGTQDFKGTTEVVWQDKEKQEQQFVTDFIVNNIAPFVNSTKTSAVTTVKAGNLLHLKTMITAQLHPNITHLKSLIAVLHPTPAVCGLPKQAAKDYILEHENYNRAFYTGFLGELNYEHSIAPRTGRRNIENRAYAVKRKSTQLYVNLRCMQLISKQALIYVGGGITKTSNAEQEWEETVSKSLVVKSILD